MFGIGAGEAILLGQAFHRTPAAKRGALVVPRSLHRDRQDERLDVDLAPEAADGADQRREYVLDDVLGARRIGQQPPREHAHAPMPPIERRRERIEATLAKSLDDRVIGSALGRRRFRRGGRARRRLGAHGSRSLTPIVVLKNVPISPVVERWSPTFPSRSNAGDKRIPAIPSGRR